MVGFLIGCMVGGTVGMVATCCCVAAGSADRELEQLDQTAKRHDR